jgi:hypothetical protein
MLRTCFFAGVLASELNAEGAEHTTITSTLLDFEFANLIFFSIVRSKRTAIIRRSFKDMECFQWSRSCEMIPGAMGDKRITRGSGLKKGQSPPGRHDSCGSFFIFFAFVHCVYFVLSCLAQACTEQDTASWLLSIEQKIMSHGLFGSISDCYS